MDDLAQRLNTAIARILQHNQTYVACCGDYLEAYLIDTYKINGLQMIFNNTAYQPQLEAAHEELERQYNQHRDNAENQRKTQQIALEVAREAYPEPTATDKPPTHWQHHNA